MLAQYRRQHSLKKTIMDLMLFNAPHSVIAEQRLLNILAISTDWQALSSKDRSLNTLRALDAIYRITVGIPANMSNVIKLSTTVTTNIPIVAPIDIVMPQADTNAKVARSRKKLIENRY